MSDPFEEFKAAVLKGVLEHGDVLRNQDSLLGNPNYCSFDWKLFVSAIENMRSCIENGAQWQIEHAAIDLARKSFIIGAMVKWKHHKSGQIMGGKKGRPSALEWRSYVSQQLNDSYKKEPRKSATEIRDSIKRTRPPEIHLPNDRGLYEFVLAELKALKKGARYLKRTV